MSRHIRCLIFWLYKEVLAPIQIITTQTDLAYRGTPSSPLICKTFIKICPQSYEYIALPIKNLSLKWTKREEKKPSMIKTCGLVCILILQYGAVLTHSEVFFFEEELIIHSQKDLNNFYTNMESLNELTKHIDKSVNYFKRKVKK